MSIGVFHCSISLSIETTPEPNEGRAIHLPSIETSALDTAPDHKGQVRGRNQHWVSPQLVNSPTTASRTVHSYYCKTCSAELVIPRNTQGELDFSADHQQFLETHTASKGCRLQLLTKQPRATTTSAPRVPSHQTSGHPHLTQATSVTAPRATSPSSTAPRAPSVTEPEVPPTQAGHLNQAPRATSPSLTAPKAPLVTVSEVPPTQAGNLKQVPRATSLSCCALKTPSHQKGGLKHQAHSGTSHLSSKNKYQNSKAGKRPTGTSSTIHRVIEGYTAAKRAANIPQSSQPSHQGHQYLEGTAIHSSLVAAQGRRSDTTPHKCGRYYPFGTAPQDIEKAFAHQGKSKLLEIHQLFSDNTLQITRATGGGHLLTSEILHCPKRSATVTGVNSPKARAVE
jgi:hypothetical protein